MSADESVSERAMKDPRRIEPTPTGAPSANGDRAPGGALAPRAPARSALAAARAESAAPAPAYRQ